MNDMINGINPDTKIQRYMDFVKFMDIMENKQLFFCKINSFDDKLEGASTPINNFFSSGAASALDNLVNNALPSTLGSSYNSPEAIADAKKRAEEYELKSKKRTLPTVFGDINITEELDHIGILRAQKNWLDISCWNIPEKHQENMAMWKIYGQSNQSVCISTTVGQLLNSLILPQSMKVATAKVKYIDHSEEYYDNSHKLDPFIHKHLAYKYESEARIIVYPQSQNPMLQRAKNPHGTSIKLKNNSFISEIKLSPEAPEWFYSLVRNIEKRYSIGVEVNRSNLDQLVESYGN